MAWVSTTIRFSFGLVVPIPTRFVDAFTNKVLVSTVIFPVTVRPLKSPNDVRELAVTELLSVFPDSVPAAAVTVIAAVPSKLTPFIALAVASAVAVAELPVQDVATGAAHVSPPLLPDWAERKYPFTGLLLTFNFTSLTVSSLGSPIPPDSW